MINQAKTCSTCLYGGETGLRCYDCKLGRGNTNAILWIGKPTCPLPKVGSKEWSWRAAHVDGYLDEYASEHTDICVIDLGGMVVVGATILFGKGRLKEGFRVAERAARKNWKREHGGKNVHRP